MKIIILAFVAAFVSGCCLGTDTIMCDPKPKYKGYSLEFRN